MKNYSDQIDPLCPRDQSRDYSTTLTGRLGYHKNLNIKIKEEPNESNYTGTDPFWLIGYGSGSYTRPDVVDKKSRSPPRDSEARDPKKFLLPITYRACCGAFEEKSSHLLPRYIRVETTATSSDIYSMNSDHRSNATPLPPYHHHPPITPSSNNHQLSIPINNISSSTVSPQLHRFDQLNYRALVSKGFDDGGLSPRYRRDDLDRTRPSISLSKDSGGPKNFQISTSPNTIPSTCMAIPTISTNRRLPTPPKPNVENLGTVVTFTNDLSTTSCDSDLPHLAEGEDDLYYKRLVANGQERRRMHRLNVALEALRKVIPVELHGHCRRLSKIKTLRTAIAYISGLKTMLASQDGSTEQAAYYDQNYGGGGAGDDKYPAPDTTWYDLFVVPESKKKLAKAYKTRPYTRKRGDVTTVKGRKRGRCKVGDQGDEAMG